MFLNPRFLLKLFEILLPRVSEYFQIIDMFFTFCQIHDTHD